MFVAKRTGLAAAAVDIEDGAGEGWGDDADLVLDDGKENMSHFNKPKYHICSRYFEMIYFYFFSSKFPCNKILNRNCISYCVY